MACNHLFDGLLGDRLDDQLDLLLLDDGAAWSCRRLIETSGREGQWYAVGQATDGKSEGAQDEVWVVARAHIFQSEELSARGAAIRERQSIPECVMNPLLAANLRLQEGEIVHVELADGKRLELPLRIEAGVADQLLTIPQGWDGAAGLALPTRGRVGRAGL